MAVTTKKPVNLADVKRAPSERIETTLGALFIADAPLGRLLDLQLGAQVRYDIARLAKAVATELEELHGQRNALVKEFGAERETTEAERKDGRTGKVTEVTGANLAAFNARFEELLKVTVTIDRRPLSNGALGETGISGRDILALGPLVTD